MLRWIVRASVNHAGVVALLAVLLLAYGGYRLAIASLDIFPEFSPKLVIIQTEAPGFAAEQVELLVSQPIESALGGLIDVTEVRSQSIQGLSVVNVVFDDAIALLRARQVVAERLSRLATEMPAGVAAPTMVPLTSSSSTVMTIGLTSASLSQGELRSLADWTLKPRLLRVAGVADVNVFGGEVRELQIQARVGDLRRHRVALAELEAAAHSAVDLRGAGFVQTPTQQITLRTTGQTVAAGELAGVVVRPGRPAIRIGDVADVIDGAAPAISKASVLAEPGVVIMIIGQFGANTLAVSRNVDAALAEVRPVLERQGVSLRDDLFRPANYIERSLAGIAQHLAVGAVMVIVVLVLFLFNLRSAFISAMAIPLSLVTATLVLLEAGVNLNIMVLGGLAIALGEVVDDAIIDTENIFRRLRENRRLAQPRPFRAVVFDASMEVRGSVVYASFIVGLAFVPLLSLSGAAGRMFEPVGVTYILAILASLAVALTVTPALCVLLLTGKRLSLRDPPLMRLLQPAYGALLRAIGRHDRLVMALVAVGLAIGLGVLPYLGSRFLPELREGHYMIHTSGVPGTSLDETIRTGARLTEAVLQVPGVRAMSQWAGRAERGADTYGSHYAEYEVDLERLSGREQQRVLDTIRGILDRFPGIVSEINTFLIERVDETISGYTAAVVVNLYGADLDFLDRKGQEIAALLRAVPGAVDVQIQAPHGVPILAVELDEQRLALHGIRPGDVYDVIQTVYEGSAVGALHDGDRVLPLVVTVTPELRTRPEAAAELPVRAASGEVIALGDVADLRPDSGRYAILHEGGRRLQTVTANVAGRDFGSFVAELQRRLNDDIALPIDSYIEITGSAVAAAQSRRELIIHSALAGIGVLLLLQLALGRAWNVALVVTNLPFSLVGGVVAALVTGGVLSLGSIVGFITLFGITLRNAIMLVSHYQHLVEIDGEPWTMDTAVRGAKERLPSILMTALVTALAMLPIAVDSDNPGREIMGPMASVIIGGMASSTLLNLLVLPSIMYRYGRFGARTGLVGEAAAAR
ncbi:MAG TPA: efflux RND transporter permease subunit [Alphaproteobacteria bacterium]